MGEPDEHVPVTEERWNQLRKLKEPDQTFDELLAELVADYRKSRLFQDVNEIRERSEFEPL